MEDLLNSNPCHNPAGPGGGEFCSGGKGGGGPASGGGGSTDKKETSSTPLPKKTDSPASPSIAGTKKDAGITKKQSDALTTYSGSRFESINSGLRGDKLSTADKKVVDDIDSAMSKTKKDSVVFEKQELYRGANVPEIAAALKGKKSLVGG